MAFEALIIHWAVLLGSQTFSGMKGKDPVEGEQRIKVLASTMVAGRVRSSMEKVLLEIERGFSMEGERGSTLLKRFQGDVQTSSGKKESHVKASRGTTRSLLLGCLIAGDGQREGSGCGGREPEDVRGKSRARLSTY